MTYNIGELLAQRANLMPQQEGFNGPDYSYTYGEVNKRCDRFASWLVAQGFKPGDRIATLAKNTEGLGTVIFAAAKADAISVVLNWRLSAEELVYILNDSGATALFFDAEFAPLVAKIKERSNVRLSICRGDPEAENTYEAIVADTSAKPCARPTRRGNDTAILMYTSGTTGHPKGAMLSHANFVAAAHGTSSTIDWLDSHRFLLVAPIFHIGGLMPLTTSVQKGSTVYFMPDFDPVKVWKVISDEKITTMMTVPAMAQAMLMVAEKMPVNAKSLVNITCGASAVPEAIISAFSNMGVSFQQVYGLTEVTGSMSFWKESMDDTRANSHGKPAFLNEMRISDPETGETLPSGQHGEVLCRGETVFSGYWNNEAATLAALKDGWFATGDIGYVDDDGFLYLVDRLKDMIISGGENIYPAEVEKVIMNHGGVAEVAVVGRTDPKWGEVPVAFVVKNPQAKVEANDIIVDCRQHLAHYKCPHNVYFIEALPRNGVGKVVKPNLRKLLKESDWA